MVTPEKNQEGVEKMGTQLQPTPVLYGEDAEAVLKVINIKQPSENLLKSQVLSQFFKTIKKKGL